MRPVPSLLALLLGVLAAVAVACGGSGGSSAGLLPGTDAEALKSALDEVDAAVAAGDCATTEEKLNAVGSAIRNLPDTTDERILARLRTSYSELRGRASDECGVSRTQTETIETTTTTEPAPTTTHAAPAVPTTTATPAPEPVPTQTTAPPAQTQTTAPNTGGASGDGTGGAVEDGGTTEDGQ